MANQSAYKFVDSFNPNDIDLFNPEKINKDQPLTINWIIPDFNTASGGHMSIFRMIYYLGKFGHKNRIYLFDIGGGLSYKKAVDAMQAIKDNYIEIDCELELGIDKMKESDIVIATSWQTAYPAFKAGNAKQKFYFVQDFEAFFYPLGSEYCFAEQTYKMGYKCITAGPWLTKVMREKYKNASDFFWLAYDKDIYKLDQELIRKRNGKRITFYGRYFTSRRAFELGILALGIVKKKRPETEIYIFGGDVSTQNIPFEYINKGILNEKELAKLYLESDVGLVFSMTNYSLINQEMMACFLPVIDIRGENTEIIFKDNENIILSEPNPHSIAEKIIHLLDNPKERERIAKNAYSWVSQFDWEKSARAVEKALYDL
jgi:glycosyltransferase involved in cell wall biosynthesis